MAVAIATPVKQTVFGDMRVTVQDVTFDNSYPTGGEPLTAANLNLNTVVFAYAHVKAVGGTQNVANVFYDIANAKLKVFDETPAESANAADLSTLVVQVTAFGF